MYLQFVAIFAIIACAAAKPGIIAPVAYTAPVLAGPGVVTATSSQYVARNHNGIAAPFVYSAPYSVAAPLAYSAPVAYSSPLAHSHFGSPFTYSSPLLFWGFVWLIK